MNSYRYQYVSDVHRIEKINIYATQLQKQSLVYNTLSDIASQMAQSDYFLCHESILHIITQDFEYRNTKKLTTWDLLHTIQDAIPVDGRRTYHTTLIDQITHNWIESKECIGCDGHISCKLHIINIDSTLYHHLHRPKIRRYPQSWHTISYCNSINSNEQYGILYIYEHSLKFLMIKGGTIDQIHTLSIGIHDLKMIYHEQHIWQYFEYDVYDSQLNDFVKQIIMTSTNFFVKQLLQRIQQCLGLQSMDCYCICDTHNHFLKQQLIEIYHHHTQHNIMYITHIEWLDSMYIGHLIDIWLHYHSQQTHHIIS